MFTEKSGSSWLDRLRSSKGFPVDNDHDLEHFLKPNPNPNSDSVSISIENQPKLNSNSVPLNENPHFDRKITMDTLNSPKNRKEENWFGKMSSVLAELFVMEDSNEFQRIKGFDEKKSSRKQSNPKICIFSSSASVNGLCSNSVEQQEGAPTMSPSSAENSVVGVKETSSSLKLKKQGNIGEEEKSQMDLSGYSRVDLMIIDTSSSVWKSEKLVFRKGNVWKIRDKKSKFRRLSGCRKKRKASQFDKESGDKKKKKKKKKKQKISLLPSIISNKVGGEECGISPYEGCPQNYNEEASRVVHPNLGEVPIKRRKFSRSPRKAAKRSSSVYHMQNVPTGRTNGVPLPKYSPIRTC